MTLSVVIVIASDTVRPASVDHLRHCLHALEEQQGSPALDIIVPHRPGVHGIDQLARRFPTVRFIDQFPEGSRPDGVGDEGWAGRRGRAERGDDGVGVVDAAAPGAAADGLQGGPEPGVVGQVGVGREVGVRRPLGQEAGPLLGAELDRRRRRPGRPTLRA